MTTRTARGLAANLGTLALTLVVLVAAAELGLRLSGFSFVLHPEEIEFGKPDPELIETGFLADDDLFWVTKDYFQKLERYRESRPRLVFMGDSCTQLGRYDQALAELVRTRRGGELSWGNLGVAGWSSHQGRRQLERDVLPLAPAVVTLYYGWNDHWIGFGVEDREVAAIKSGLGRSRFQGSRLVQLVTKARLALGSDEEAYPNRVPLEDFRDNLRAMVATARAAGVVPVLITAPSAHVEGAEPEVLGTRWLRDVDELVPLHRAYVDAVREVATTAAAVLCDAAATFESLPRPELERLMMTDGIHLTPAGDARLAELLYDCLERAVLLEAVVAG